MTKNAISVDKLNVRFGRDLILKDVNVQIDDGELVYFFGANGSGKTTFVKSILGLNEFSGEIKIFGDKNTKKKVSKHCGYVPQYVHIDRSFPINVGEMLELECGLSPHCSINVKEHLNFIDAEHLIDRKIGNLSGGELQKVLIARALASTPDIIIMDEPINNLDEAAQHDLIDFIKKLNKEHGKTIIVISHDFNIIEHDSKHRILLVSDKTIREESEESLIHNQQLITQHIH